ncbi:MAG: hypothetical protein IKL30_03300, partial [Anaerotignum sp.]|nr:hypothetical protein [Anaerotignum sp.]
LIDQCCFAMVNMGNDGNISDIFNVLFHIELLQSYLSFLLRTTVYYSTVYRIHQQKPLLFFKKRTKKSSPYGELFLHNQI